MLPFFFILGRPIPAYGLFMAIGVLVGSFGACWQAHKRKLNVDMLIVYIACCFGNAIVCGSILYDIVTYGLAGFFKLIITLDFDTLLGQTGIVFYGGLAGGLIGALIARKITKIEPKTYYVCIVPFIPLGHAFGRIGCFFAGCCYGMETDGPFGVKFKHSLAGLSPDVAVIPTQLIEAGCDVLVAIYLIKKYCINKKENNTNVLYEYIILYAVMRFFIEFLRGDLLRGKLLFLSTSQWISIAFIIGISILTIIRKKRES